MIKSLTHCERCLVRFVCALALMLVGLAHMPPAVAQHSPLSGEISEFALPDGTQPVLCISKDGTSKTGSSGQSACEACRLAASVLLPLRNDAIGARLPRKAERVETAYAEIRSRQRFAPNASPRGPPSGLTI